MTTWTPDRVRALRLALGVTQLEFAEHLGVSYSAVSKWESGVRRPGHGLTLAALDRAERRAQKQAAEKGEAQ